MKQFLYLVKNYLKDKKLSLLILGAFLGLFAFGLIYMLGSFDLEEFASVFESFPEGLIEFFGDPAEFSTPYGFLCLEFFTLIWVYAGIFLMYSAGSLLPQEVEGKTIELALSKPVSRVRFLGSKIASLYLYIMGMLGIVFLIVTAGVSTSQIFIDNGLVLERVWGLYFIVVLFLGSLAMLSVFFSSIFLNSKKSIVFAIVTFFVMFFLGTFYKYIEGAENIKYFSVLFYYNPVDYLVHGSFDIFGRDLLVLGGINAALVVSSLIIFKKKDITI